MATAPRLNLSRSCAACVKTKRKCDLGLPECSRCSKRRVPCVYKNEPLPTKPSFESRKTPEEVKISNLTSDLQLENPRAKFFESLEDLDNLASSSDDSIESEWDSTQLLPFFNPLVRSELKPPDYVIIMDMPSKQYIFSELKSLPAMLVQTGGTTFIHPRLYRAGLPVAMQNAYAACSMSITQSAANRALNSQTFDLMVAALLATASSVATFTDRLAFVQALVLIQILTLLNPAPTVVQRLQGERRQRILDKWTWKLWQQAPSILPESLSAFEAFVLAESVRRTVIISNKVRLTYETIRTGHFLHTHFCEALPFDRRTELWSLDDEELWNLVASGSRPEIVSYREFTDLWDKGEIVTPTQFEMLLLVACRGRDNVAAEFQRRQSL